MRNHIQILIGNVTEQVASACQTFSPSLNASAKWHFLTVP